MAVDSALGDNPMGVNQLRDSLGVFPTPVPGPVQKSRHHLGLGLQHFEQRGVGAWGTSPSPGCKVGWAGGLPEEEKEGTAETGTTHSRVL